MEEIENRGFASMSPERRKEVAAKGGRASSGNFKNDPKRASEMGRKGALAQSIEHKRKAGIASAKARRKKSNK